MFSMNMGANALQFAVPQEAEAPVERTSKYVPLRTCLTSAEGAAVCSEAKGVGTPDSRTRALAITVTPNRRATATNLVWDAFMEAPFASSVRTRTVLLHL